MKKTAQKVTYPICKQVIELGIELQMKVNINDSIYLPHIHLHEEPVHALQVHINSELKVRNVGVIRSTFLIDPEGKIAHIWPKVSVKGHPEEVKTTLTQIKATA